MEALLYKIFEILQEICEHQFFGVVLTLAAYCLGYWVYKRTKMPFLHPVLVAVVLIIAVLAYFKIPLESYNRGGDLISLFLSPVTAVLAYQIYKQRRVLVSYFIPVLVGCIVGSATSIFSVIVLCRVFGLNKQIMFSLLPKSITTPIAMEVSVQLGGISSLTVAVVILTGIMGAVLAPIFIKILRIHSKVAAGAAIGTSSHAIGTSKAIEIGEVEGAVSGISIGLAGIITVIFSAIFAAFM